jgi:hypothetical protein
MEPVMRSLGDPSGDALGDPLGQFEFEPGWAAARALMSVGNDDLLAVMLRPSFRPIGEHDVVPVRRCPYCCDGGMRTAGAVRTRLGRELVRACDTCGAVEIGETPLRQASHGA